MLCSVMAQKVSTRTPSRSPRVKRERVISFAVVLAVMLASFVVVRLVGPTPPLTEVPVVAGTENQPFFSDQQVIAAFARHGLKLDVDYEGSWQMTTAANTCHYALMIPSSQPAADAITQKCHVNNAQPAYYSPMVVVTFDNIAALLSQEGIATRDPKSGEWNFSLPRYLRAVQNGLRWNQIPGNGSYQSPNKVLLTTTDPRTSNSAAMYAAMIAYLLNNEIPLSSSQNVAQVQSFIGQSLFLDQGYSQGSSELPFDDVRGSLGEAVSPMVWAYESQYLDVRVHLPSVVAGQRLVVMYPSPTAVSYHTVVPTSGVGAEVGQLLTGATTDPALLNLEAEHGFRTLDPQDTFTSVMRTHGITVPTAPQVAPLPAFEYLQELLTSIGQMYGH
jgi:hypothetical protein